MQPLPCIWNVQLSDHTLAERCYLEAADIKVSARRWGAERWLWAEDGDSCAHHPPDTMLGPR